MSSVDRMNEYLLANGGVPASVQAVVELDQRIGEKFAFKDVLDATSARAGVGLVGKLPRQLPNEERLRLANLLRRAGKISDEELTVLGMVAIPIRDALSRVQENRERDQPLPSRYDPLPFQSLHQRDR